MKPYNYKPDKYKPDIFYDLKPGTLMRVPISVSWHSGYYIEEDGSLGEDMRLNSGDVVMYLETQINTWQPDIKRYKCLFGDRFILMNERALVPVYEPV